MTAFLSTLKRVRRLPALILVGILRAYQTVISPMTGPSCKYYPSCSSYGITALRTHGFFRGSAMAAWRILRCNPWSHGGVDDVPPPRKRDSEHQLAAQ